VVKGNGTEPEAVPERPTHGKFEIGGLVGVNLLEKLVTALSAIAILVVAACVTFFSFVTKSSGIDDSVVNTVQATQTWLDGERRRSTGQAVTVQPWRAPAAIAAPAPGQQPTANGKPVPGAPAGNANAPGVGPAPNAEVVISDSIPQQQQVPGIPWLKAQPGVTYNPPVTVPQIVAQKYTAFDDAFQEAQSGGGEFVQTPAGNAYQINWVDPNSYLARTIGLQPGDKVISVNGHPVGNSFASNKQLYDTLKGDRRFAVRVLRGGADTMLSFSVGN
jgi:hypothetical protein